ncbi:hypothetical protein ACYOEI_05130 [Singulisphaera rosea]
MKVGTKSVLFGAHCFFIHPWFVALAWWQLYGFPWDPRLWVAFFLHDLGYWGSPNMDGPEGERHVEWAARVMGRLFDNTRFNTARFGEDAHLGMRFATKRDTSYWHDLCMYHSRFYCRRDGRHYSELCVADKLALYLEPWWLYLPRVMLSGEIKEYMIEKIGGGTGKYKGEPNSAYVESQLALGSIRGWHRGTAAYCRDWAWAHKDGRADTWTPTQAGAPASSTAGTVIEAKSSAGDEDTPWRSGLRRLIDRIPHFDVGDGRGDIFFRRWKLIPTPWVGIYLHQFFRSDNDRCLHDHPWAFVSVILRGGYWEEMADGRHWRGPGSILVRRAEDAHRIELEPGTRPWSLVFVGRKVRPWGFHTIRGWIPWVKGQPNPVCETGPQS